MKTIADFRDNDVQQYNSRLEQLEDLVDVTSFQEVLEMLANVAGEKAEHLRVNWQSENDARIYDDIEEILINTMIKLQKKGINT
mgnify:CR=1 FL=1